MTIMELLETLRQAVAKDGRPHVEISKAAGIHPKTFSAFMHGRRGLSVRTIESLLVALRVSIELAKDKRKPKTS